MSRRLFRSRTDRVLGGVCGGLGTHFDADPVIFRLTFVLMTVMGGSGILIYIIMLLIIPKEPAVSTPAVAAPAVSADTLPVLDAPTEDAVPARGHPRGAVAGVILVALGVLFLASNLGLFWWWRWKILWPVVLVALGLWLLFARNGKE